VLAGSRTCRLTGVMRSPPARGSRWPFYRLAGHRFFSLRLTLSRGRGWSNVLECDSKFVRCVILIWWMTSCTVGKIMCWLGVQLVLAWWGLLQLGDLVDRITGQLVTVFLVFVWHYLVEGFEVMCWSVILSSYGAWYSFRGWLLVQLEYPGLWESYH